jgi:hypothetical protein
VVGVTLRGCYDDVKKGAVIKKRIINGTTPKEVW